MEQTPLLDPRSAAARFLAADAWPTTGPATTGGYDAADTGADAAGADAGASGAGAGAAAAAFGWGRRAEPLNPTELAALIGRVTDRCAGMLFTATATEDLDGLGVWARLQDLATAGMWRQIVQTSNRAGGRQRPFIGDEVALSTRLTPLRGATETEVAIAVCALPGLVEAVEDGTLTHWHARTVLRELDRVPALLPEQRQAVVLIVLARYRGQDSNTLGKDTARLIASIDPAAAAGRKQAADARRQTQSWPEADGQAVFALRGPAERIAEVIAAVRATADAQAAEQAAACAAGAAPADERCTDQRLFDAAVDLLTGGAQAGSWQVDLIVPFSVSQGGDLELAELPGLGPVLPGTARDLLDRADRIARIGVDRDGHVLNADAPQPMPHPTAAAPTTATGQRPGTSLPTEPVWPLRDALRQLAAAPVVLADLAVAGYVVPARLRRFLQARDRTCTFPGCHRPATRTDKDHAIPWPLGPTSPANVGCLCRRHHRAKQANFRLLRLPDGTVRWITRGHQWHDRPPQGF